MNVLSDAELMRFTDEELIRSLDEHQHHSPIIKALCQRLEQRLNDEPESLDGESADCPVCQAQLVARIPNDNNHFLLEVKE